MSLRMKLMLLVGGVLFIFAMAIGTYFLFQSQIENMRRESEYFRNLSLVATEIQAELNLLATTDFKTQSKRFAIALISYRDTIAGMKGITLLPSINETLGQAVDAVKQVTTLSSESLDVMEGQVRDLQTDIQNAKMGRFIIIDVLRLGTDNSVLTLHMNMLLASIANINSTLSLNTTAIKSKDTEILVEITRLQQQSTDTTGIIVIALALLIIIFTLFITSTIAQSFKQIETNVRSVSLGDLRCHFNLNRNDEIGKLGRNLNSLLGALNTSMREIHEASRQNMLRRDELRTAVQEATSSTIEIGANSTSIHDRMSGMDTTIAVSTRDMNAIMSTMNDFVMAIDRQNHHIEESVAAVTQMLASIGNISRITDKDKAAAARLVTETERGQEVFDSTFDRVSEITESIGEIQKMADVIAGIASQTNILAMNAAIEAAHAGEFGKGFAVVADEISKLAGAAATSSDEIAHTIRTIVEKIKEAGSTRNETIDSFKGIRARIDEVSNSIGEIYSNVHEIQTGSRQILEAMEGLRESSTLNTVQSQGILESSGKVQMVMGQISMVSHEVVSNIEEIGMGLKDITRSIQSVESAADTIGNIANNIDTAINHFSIED